MTPHRFDDEVALLFDFVEEVLAECPRCGSRCRVACERPWSDHEPRASCGACGFSRRGWVSDERAVRLGAPVDPYYGFPLWLRIACAGHTLWAYNRRHLAFLRDFSAAPLRERSPGRNASLASRLPGWLKQASNRDAVARAVARLEAKAAR